MPRWLAIALLSLACTGVPTPAKATSTLQDGPYVSITAEGRWTASWIEGDTSAPRIREQAVTIGQTVEVPAVGLAPAFRVRLRGAEPVAPGEVSLPAGSPLFVVADTHGQFQIFAQLLRKHGVIDQHLNWSYGKGHLAMLGDVFDRGPNHTEIFWLIYKLEDEAAQAGGAVHLLLGNHETFLMRGDESTLHRKYLQVRDVMHVPGYAWLWDDSTLLGRWLRSKASVLKLGDYLLLHGGISREVIERGLTVAQMNQVIRDVVNHTAPSASGQKFLPLLSRNPKATDAERALAEFVMGRTGPQWYRGYFNDDAREADLAWAVTFYGVKSILVGHTIVDSITPMYGGRAIGVQVYPHYAESPDGSPIAEALRIENERFYRAKVDGYAEPLKRFALQRALRETITAEGVAQAERAYARWKANGLTEYEIDERRINAMGEEYLQQGKRAEALLLLRVNAERFPDSSRAHERLGEVYEKGGQREQAITHYRKSLALEPRNKHARERLDALDVDPTETGRAE